MLAVALVAALAGCSDIYTDRRETVTLHAGDAMASNRVTHMIDPWPRASGNRDIAFNGERMQTAHERYRTGCVILPINPTTTITSDGSTQRPQKEPQCAPSSQAAPAAPPGGNKP